MSENLDPTNEQPTKWPKTIGIISLIYGILGLLCQASFVAWVLVVTDRLFEMGGMDVEMPFSIKLVTAVSAILLFILGIVMVLGSVNLLRRRAVGVKMLKVWAILRLLIVVIGLALHVVMIPDNMRLQRSIETETNEQLRDAGKAELPPKTDERLWRESLITGVIATGLFAIYPVFLGFYLSRRKITDEVAQWR